MIRFFDIIFSLFGLIFFSFIGIIVAIINFFYTEGSPIFIQERVGKDEKLFNLIKYRTMRKDTSSVATHLVPKSNVTKFGLFLRKTKLDEFPQLINVLVGDMSLVGPRPNLENQKELIQERRKRKVYDYLPGITGLAQVNNIDMSNPVKLAETDAEMLKNLNLKNYFKYIFMTILGKGSGDNVKA